MCRVRSIREVAKYFHDMDPDTQLTEWTIRNMISEGTIPAVKSGGKYLINLDLLLQMLGGMLTGSDKIQPVAPLTINK